ncbi:MAG: Chaperone SurA [Catillopecten margaritatus gill symbiont]|uniref:Chaperone SurA n=1 Tax=Catillopecten margaritatus gill symbiont TaxID=3083288 RepID=A0AAU6PFQ0_9GAMM
MKTLLTLLLTLSFGVLAAPNSIIAIVNDSVITMDNISTNINKETTREEKIALVERQINIELQKEKIQALGITPKSEIISKALENVATQNGLTFEQLRTNNQYEQIVKTITQNLSLGGLEQVILQQANIKVTQAEINTFLAKNPKADNAKAQIIRTKQTLFLQKWIKDLRKNAYIEIFANKLK